MNVGYPESSQSGDKTVKINNCTNPRTGMAEWLRLCRAKTLPLPGSHDYRSKVCADVGSNPTPSQFF